MSVSSPGPGRAASNRDLERIVADVFADHRCHACDASDWEAVIATDEDVATGIQFFNWRTGAPFGFTACVPLICRGCGLVETYEEERLVARWRERWGDG